MITTTFVTLYTTLRKVLRDPKDGGVEGASPRWTLTEKKQAINDAIADAFPVVRVPYVDDTTITLATDTFVYTLPAGVKRAQDVTGIWLEPSSTSSPWNPLRSGWRVLENNGTLKLYLDSIWASTGKKLRMAYVGAPAALVADADTTVVPANFVLARARYYCHTLAAESAAKDDTELHLARAKLWWDTSAALLAEIAVREGERLLGDGKVQVSGW